MKNKGTILINSLVFAVISMTVIIGLTNWGASLLKNTKTMTEKEQAFQIAEAGIEYYRWHLAHAQSDYKDGTNQNGPYVHDYTDAQGNIIGQFSLTITPPISGSTLVKIKSTGTLASSTNISRSIEATLGIPSLAKYAVVANNFMRFGSGTEVYGPIHSNAGIRFDGIAHNIITSSVASFDDPDTSGSTKQFGVYTTVNPADPIPPSAVPNRPDVFMAGRQFPIQTYDFNGLTADLSTLKTQAQTSGRYIASSGSLGYRILLKTNGTFDLYKVTSLQNAPNGCSNSLNQDNWGTWSIKNQTFVANYSFPSNGIIFVEDHVWVEGQINSARLTIAVGKFPDNVTTRKSITVNNDLLYSKYDGTDVISLIAQGDFNIGLYSDDNLRIDGAIIAQNGRAGRYYYGTSCQANGTDYHIRNTVTLYGMIATNERYGFAYTDNTGYTNRNIIYDSNLLYGPPPSFPLTASQYSIVSWQEVQ
jgi:type II secretory pathway pseudopilin PulG